MNRPASKPLGAALAPSSVTVEFEPAAAVTLAAAAQAVDLTPTEWVECAIEACLYVFSRVGGQVPAERAEKKRADR